MGGLLQDIRFRLRAIARHPATTIVAVLSLALGIGANSAVFSIVDGMFLRPWSVEEPDELVWVRHRALEGQGSSMAYADYLDVRAQNTVFSGLVAESRRGGLLKVGGETNLVLVNAVSENFFEVLGVDAAAGRAFSPELDANAADPGVILSHSLWTRRFGQDPEIIGQTIELTGRLFPVVGVMPPSFRGLARMLSVDIWVPPATWVALSGGDRGEFDNRGVRSFHVLGRLRPDASLAEAEAQLVTIAIGIGLALVLGRLMASSLHGVSPADPLTLVVSCLIVVAVGLAASLVPTKRATRVDPMQVLRND